MTDIERRLLVLYIFQWLRRRNGGELSDAIGKMTVDSYELAVGELEMIIEHNGKPPNWSGPS